MTPKPSVDRHVTPQYGPRLPAAQNPRGAGQRPERQPAGTTGRPACQRGRGQPWPLVLGSALPALGCAWPSHPVSGRQCLACKHGSCYFRVLPNSETLNGHRVYLYGPNVGSPRNAYEETQPTAGRQLEGLREVGRVGSGHSARTAPCGLKVTTLPLDRESGATPTAEPLRTGTAGHSQWPARLPVARVSTRVRLRVLGCSVVLPTSRLI